MKKWKANTRITMTIVKNSKATKMKIKNLNLNLMQNIKINNVQYLLI